MPTLCPYMNTAIMRDRDMRMRILLEGVVYRVRLCRRLKGIKEARIMWSVRTKRVATSGSPTSVMP